MEETTFYLHSKENANLHPSKKYPLTHSIYCSTVQHQISKSTISPNIFPIILFLIFFMSTVHQIHINIYDSIFGPHHLTLIQFYYHVENFNHGQNEIQYIQVELGENNFYSSSSESKYGSIQGYENGRIIATYDYLETPKMYIKVPTLQVSHVHTKLPFDFSKFSLTTLNCICQTLSARENLHKSLIEKSDYVAFIEAEYAKNVKLFNIKVLTKCGIFIGYLYKPLNEVAYLPEKGYHVEIYGVVFDTSIPYIRYYSFLVFGIYIGLIVFAVYDVVQDNIVRIKYQLLSSLPLILQKDVLQELQKLGTRIPSVMQLLKLDEAIAACENQIKSQLFIIKNQNDKDFVVVLPKKRKSMKDYDKRPFFIMPLSAIENVTAEGVYYSHQQFRWPNASAKDKKEFACWLHENLIRKSENYRFLVDREILQQLTIEEEIYFVQNHYYLALSQRHPQWSWYLNYLITDHPVPVRAIAIFRLRQHRNPQFVDEMILKNDEECPICREHFVLNEQYYFWPCASRKHVFHYDCTLKQYRTNNACPLCREPAELQ